MGRANRNPLFRMRQQLSLHRTLRRCDQKLRSVGLSGTLDAHALCKELSQHPSRSGRPIHLLPMSLKASEPCGLWIATDSTDYIIFEQDTTISHQNHIIAHEVGHILLEHRSTSTLASDAATVLFPHLAPEVVVRFLGRSRYDSTEEREAEIMATLLRHGLSRQPSTTDEEDRFSTADAVTRLRRSLEG